MPSFASPLNLALLSYKIHVQYRRPEQLRGWGGGGRGLQHPESVWEMLNPLILSDFIVKQAGKQPVGQQEQKRGFDHHSKTSLFCR